MWNLSTELNSKQQQLESKWKQILEKRQKNVPHTVKIDPTTLAVELHIY